MLLMKETRQSLSLRAGESQLLRLKKIRVGALEKDKRCCAGEKWQESPNIKNKK